MRIEKINEKQIRCTLNQKDLKDREIEISELAYGSAKAKALFRDLIQQASYEFGFEAEDIPLMIEAIPLLPEALILLVTKVEDPDELDTRFSCFTEEKDWTDEDEIYSYDFSEEDEEDTMSDSNLMDSDFSWKYEDASDDSMIQGNPSHEVDSEPNFISLPETLGMQPRPSQKVLPTDTDITVVFHFPSLDTVIQAAEHINVLYSGDNTLYKDSKMDAFYLVLHRCKHTPNEFNKICNILQEYGTILKNTRFSQYYYEEHFKPMIDKHAIQSLATL